MTSFLLPVDPNINSVQLPTPSVDPGPQWAQDLNTAITDVCAHDHTPGNGKAITPAAININSALTLNTNYLNAVKAVRFVNFPGAQTGSADFASIYFVNNDAYITNGNGIAVRLTAGGSVNAQVSGSLLTSTPNSFPYTIQASDSQHMLLVTTTVARTINLLAASAFGNGMLIIKDISGQAQTNNISVVPNGTDNIEGLNTTYLLQTNYGSVALWCDGNANYWIQ